MITDEQLRHAFVDDAILSFRRKLPAVAESDLMVPDCINLA